MPQYELEAVGRPPVSGLHRGRTPEEAIRRAAGLDAAVPVQVATVEDVQAWQEVTIDGTPAGRIRLHQRMRFRRD